MGNSPPTSFYTSGEYQIGLVAWEGNPACADTTWKTVVVYDSLSVLIPNVFTPNQDEINDFFTLTTNLPTETQLTILNRWENEVFKWNGTLNAGINHLWDGKTKENKFVSDGTYFYKIQLSLDPEKTNCEKKECVIKKEGFVQVVGK